MYKPLEDHCIQKIFGKKKSETYSLIVVPFEKEKFDQLQLLCREFVDDHNSVIRDQSFHKQLHNHSSVSVIWDQSFHRELQDYLGGPVTQ